MIVIGMSGRKCQEDFCITGWISFRLVQSIQGLLLTQSPAIQARLGGRCVNIASPGLGLITQSISQVNLQIWTEIHYPSFGYFNGLPIFKISSFPPVTSILKCDKHLIKSFSSGSFSTSDPWSLLGPPFVSPSLPL